MNETWVKAANAHEMQRAEREQLELTTEYVEPTSATERRLAEVYARVFGVDRVGIDDDFFELGGDSFTAATMSTALAAEMQIEIKPSRFVEINTVRKMAAQIGDGGVAGEHPLPPGVSGLNREGTRPPLFVIHGGGGVVFLWPEFLAALSPDQPVYLFEARGYDGQAAPHGSVPEMSEAYVRAVLDICPSGPWNFMAFCAGSWIAVEMVRQMKLESLEPANVILLDPISPKALSDEFREKQIERYVRVPALAHALSSASEQVISLISTLNFFRKTGILRDPRAVDAMTRPEVFEAAVNVDMGKLMRNKLRRHVRVRGPDGGEHPYLSASNVVAAQARVMVKHALRHFRPEISRERYVIIGSEKLRREMVDPKHPVNCYLPNHTFLVSGTEHEEAVASPRTAALIQDVIAGVTPK